MSLPRIQKGSPGLADLLELFLKMHFWWDLEWFCWDTLGKLYQPGLRGKSLSIQVQTTPQGVVWPSKPHLRVWFGFQGSRIPGGFCPPGLKAKTLSHGVQTTPQGVVWRVNPWALGCYPWALGCKPHLKVWFALDYPWALECKPHLKVWFALQTTPQGVVCTSQTTPQGVVCTPGPKA